MDHDECDPSELESFLQSCLDSANATLLDADDPLSGGGPLSAPPVHSAVLGGALSSPAPVLNSRVVRPAASSAPPPLASAIGSGALSTPASRNTRVVANGLPAAVSVSAPVPVITQPLLSKAAGSAGGRHKPLNGVLMVPTPVHAAASPLQAAAPARPPPGPQASPVPAASPFSAARSPGQSPAPAAGSPVSLSQARVITSLAAPAAVVPALPHGVIISQSGALLSQSPAAILSQAGAHSVVGDYRSQQQQQQQQQRAQTQQRQSVLTGAFHQPGSGLITAGTIVPNGLQNLQVVSAPQNGGVMHLVQPTQPQAAAARQQKAGAGKQPQLLPKTLAPSLPLAKQTLTQPPMMLAPSGLGCGGGGPMVLTPVMIQQPGGGHQIQFILREQPNLLFPAQAAGGGKAPPQQAVLLPTTGGGQTVLLQHPGQLLPQAGPMLQPAIRLVAPQLPPQLYAVAPQQSVVPQALQLAAPQQQELLKPAAQQQPTQQPSAAVQAAQRNRASGGSKKKRRDDMPAHHLSQQSMSQPQKKAFVDLEDIMKKSGIFGDMDDEPGLHTEPDIKAEATAEASHQTVVQPLQGTPESLQSASARLAPPPPSVGLGAASGYHGPSSTASKVVLNGAAALVSAPSLPAVSLLSGSLAQPVLSYAAGPGRPHLLAAASQPLTQTTLLQAAPRVSAPPLATCGGTASSVLGNLLSQPSRQPRPPQPQQLSQSQPQTHSVSGAAQPAVAAPAAALHVPGGLSLAVAPAVSAAVQAVSAGGAMVPVVKSSAAAVTVPLSQSLYHVGTVAAGQSPALQNVFLENLIKNQLQVRTNSKKKKKEPVTRVSSVRSVSASAVSSPSSVDGRRTSSVDSGPAAVSPAARVTAAADNSVTSTTPAEPAAALRPPTSCAPAASSVSFSSSLPQTSFTVAGAGAATPPPPPSASAARSSVPSAPRQLAPAAVGGAAGGRSPAAAVSAAASVAEPTHKVAIQLTPENQQELNRVQLRMQLLLRADRPQRDADELRRLEATRQKILASGQQVRWPVPTSGAAPASAVMSPPAAAAAPSVSAPLQLTARGTKRPQEPAADQRTDRFLQQLSRDQRTALQPDADSPFQSVSDAVRRLAAYHVFQEPPPGHQQLTFEEQHFQARAEYIHNKRHNMYNKYRRLLLKDSMRLHPSSESVQILRYLNQHDRDQLDQERRAAAAARPAGGGATPRPSKVRRDAAESSQPAAAADAPPTPVKAEPAPPSAAGGDVPLRPDPTLRHVRLPPPASADTDFDRLFDEPLVNGHGHGDGARLEDDLNEQVQSAIKSILSIPREPELTGPGGPGPGGGGGSGGGPGPGPAAAPLAESPPVPSRFNINASFFNADDTGDDSEALDEAVRSILL